MGKKQFRRPTKKESLKLSSEEQPMTLQETRRAFLDFADSHPNNNCHPRNMLSCKCGYVRLRKRILREYYEEKEKLEKEKTDGKQSAA
jgi:hypothetical protein